MRLLLAEDDTRLVERLRPALLKAGYVVEWAEKIDYQGKALRIKIEIGGEEERIFEIES